MRLSAVTALLGAGLLLATLAPPVLAVDPIPGRPLPEEPPVTRLDVRAVGSLVADVDGDGTREVLAATAEDAFPGFAAIQAWWIGADGAPTASNQVRVRRSAAFDDRVAIGNGIRIDEDGMTGVRIGEPIHLFTVRRDGRDVPLVAALGTNPELTSPCCLTIWEVAAAGPGAIGLRLAAELHQPGVQLVVADLDADGTDEMLVTEVDFVGTDPVSSTAAFLSWDGSAYAVSRTPIAGGGCCPLILDAADSDGSPGDDILLTESGADGGPGGMTRLTLRRASLTAERGMTGIALDPVAVFSARIMELPGEPSILTTDGQFARVWSWPRDGELQQVLNRPNRNSDPLAVLGSGSDTLVIMGDPGASLSLEVYEAGPAVWTVVSTDSRAAAFAAVAGATVDLATWTPVGVVPGGLPNEPEAFAFGGMLLLPTGNPGDAIRLDPIAILPGRSVAGTVGTDGEWTVTHGAPREGLVAERREPWIVDVMSVLPAGPLDLTSTASVLDPEAEFGLLLPTFDGAAPDPNRPTAFIVGHEPMDATLEGPPGTRVWWTLERGPTRETTVEANGITRIRLLEPTEASEGEATVFSIWAVTPVGHAYHGAWRLRVYRQPPDLGMDGEVPLIDFAPTVSGRTLPGSTLTLNGQPAEVAADGSFAVPVMVGIVPTEIRIAVTDPVGNRTEQVVSRVWPIDYRQLPWVPITVFLTVTIGFALYMREADARPGRRLTPEDESTFEEIGG